MSWGTPQGTNPGLLGRGITEVSGFGSHDYSKEELTAEMTSAYLCGHCGIEAEVIENNAAYIQGWLKQLRNNTKWLIQAAGHAQKAAAVVDLSSCRIRPVS